MQRNRRSHSTIRPFTRSPLNDDKQEAKGRLVMMGKKYQPLTYNSDERVKYTPTINPATGEYYKPAERLRNQILEKTINDELVKIYGSLLRNPPKPRPRR